MAGQGEACRGCGTADVLRARIAELEAMIDGGNFENWIAASRAVIRGDAGAVSDLYDAMPTDDFQRRFAKPST